MGHEDVLTERPHLCGGVESASKPPALAPKTSEVSNCFSDEPSDGIASIVKCSSSLQPLVSSDPEKMEAAVASVSPAVGKAYGKTDRKPSPATGWSMVSVEPSAAALVFLAVEEAPGKIDQKPSSAKGLLRQGFLGSRTASPSSLEVKEVSSLTRTGKEDSFTLSQKMGPPITESQASHTVSKVAHKGLSDGSSLGAAELGMRLRLSSWNDGEWNTYLFLYFQVSTGDLGYSQRVKKKISKQLNKNKKLLAENVEDTPMIRVEGYSEGVLNVMELTPNLGLTFGGNEKRLSDLFSVIEEEQFCEEEVSISNSKGKRELKNLECSINSILRLEIVALVGSKAGWFRLAL